LGDVVSSGGDGSGSPYEQTARVLRAAARLDRVARIVLATLTDAIHRRRDGSLRYPALTLKELGAMMGAKAYSPSTMQRKLRILRAAKLLQMFRRPGRAYLFVPLVDQLPLALADGARQAPLPLPPMQPGELEFRAVPAPAVRGARGRFRAVPVEGDFNRSGQIDRTPVENLTGVPLDFEASATPDPGQIDRTLRSNRPDTPVKLTGPPACTKEVQNSDHRGEHAGGAGALPITGIAMTEEQRRRNARDPSPDGNASVLLAMAFHLGTDDVEAAKYSAVPIDTPEELLEALKTFAAQSAMRYDLQGPTGEGVVRFAAQVAWKSLVRRGIKHDPSELEEQRRRDAWRAERRRKRGRR
jgi:hypothetical protein